MTLPSELEKAEVAYSYKCELCGIREWHVKPTTKFHYNNVNKCSGVWVEEKWFNTSFLEKNDVVEAVAFFKHLKNHPEVKTAPVHAGIPVCKICGKSSKEIAVFGGEKK